MDVGGSLTKIVYFETKIDKNSVALSTTTSIDNLTGKQDSVGATKNVTDDNTTLVKRKSSEILAQLDQPDHQAALEKLYSYMDTARDSDNSVVVRDDILSVYSDYLGGKLHFLHFETKNMADAIQHVNLSAPVENIRTMGCTGGGAHKYARAVYDALEITFNKLDELGTLIRGMHFALCSFKNECYTFRNADHPLQPGETIDIFENSDSSEEKDISDKRWQKDNKSYTKKIYLPYNTPYNTHDTFPYLIVNVGSGVSIIKVTSPGQFERVSGTSLGGGTYWGLCRLLTNCKTYEEVLDKAENGDAGKVDMLVRDIYGKDCTYLCTCCYCRAVCCIPYIYFDKVQLVIDETQ